MLYGEGLEPQGFSFFIAVKISTTIPWLLVLLIIVALFFLIKKKWEIAFFLVVLIIVMNWWVECIPLRIIPLKLTSSVTVR